MKSRLARVVAAATYAIVAVIGPAGAAQADEIRDDQWHLRYLKIAEAHRYSQGEGVTVAVVDTGVTPHPDLRANLLPGQNVVSNAGNGQTDADGHGTVMAGIIAAYGHGSEDGAFGIAPKAKILPVRDQVSGRESTTRHTARAIEWAVKNGASIINISGGGGPDPELRKAVEAAVKADVVIVASVGNAPDHKLIAFPAALEDVVAVGATDSNGNRARVSVTGSKIELVAPGERILSTGPAGKYRLGTGTSPSAAIVSGAAALVRSKYPELSAKEVVHRLTATAVDKGPKGRDEEYGYGVVDLVAALTADVPPLPAEEAASTPPTAPPASPTALAGGDDADDGLTPVALAVGIGSVLLLIVIVGATAWLVIRGVRRSRRSNA